MSAVSRKAVEAAAWLNAKAARIEAQEEFRGHPSGDAEMFRGIATLLTTPTEASAPVQPEPDAGLIEVVEAMARFDGRNNNAHLKQMAKDALASLRRTQPSTAQPSQGEAVAHPLSDEHIAEYWPDVIGEDGRVEIRKQFDALMAQLRLVWHRSFPRHHELFAEIATDKAAELPNRIADLKAAIAGLPQHWRQWQWRADEKPVFGERHVRSVYGDNGHGMGRQVIAAVPADKHYFGTVADFIAAANPDTITMLLSRLDQLEAAAAPVDVGAAVAAEREHADDCPWDKTRLTVQRRCTCGALEAIRQSTLGEPKEGGENG